MSHDAEKEALAEIILRTHEPGFANVRGSRLRDTLLDQFREVADAVLAAGYRRTASRDADVARRALLDAAEALRQDTALRRGHNVSVVCRCHRCDVVSEAAALVQSRAEQVGGDSDGE